jgi:hypothetical protein
MRKLLLALGLLLTTSISIGVELAGRVRRTSR